VTGWFRWWNGSFSDAKFGLVAMRAKRSVPDVLAVWIALLEHAAQCNERGCVTDCRAEEIAWHLRIEGEAVSEIIAAMTDRGMIVGGRIEAWERRQPSREDAVGKGSKPVAERVAAHRERKKQEQGSERNADVTQCNADVTPQNRTEQNRTEHKNPSGAPSNLPTKDRRFPARLRRCRPRLILQLSTGSFCQHPSRSRLPSNSKPNRPAPSRRRAAQPGPHTQTPTSNATAWRRFATPRSTRRSRDLPASGGR
jgi:hypothetical protein